MVLHPPESAAIVPQLESLHTHVVARQHHCAVGELLDVIAVHGDRLEHRGFARKHRMATTRLAELDAPGEAEFPSARVAAYAAAGGAHGHLQAPAAAEERRAGCKHSARQLDLPLDGRAAVVDIERRAGNRHAIVAGKPGARSELHLAIRRPDDVAAYFRQTLQHLRVAFAGRPAAGGNLLRACRRAVAVDHENSRSGHVRAIPADAAAPPAVGLISAYS